jgi:adenylosuccinate lyase
MLAEVASLVERLVVYPERMRTNIELTAGAIYSQPVLLALVDAGMDRQQAYRLVQQHATAAWNGGPHLRQALANDPVVTALLSRADLDKLFDPTRQLTHVDAVFARLGLVQAAERLEVAPEVIPA